MENAADALKIGFALLVFVIALSMAFMSISLARETSDIITYAIDRTNFYPKVDGKDLVDEKGNRLVKADTVISSIYRCYNEGFAVIIQDTDGKTVIAKFDLDSETNTPWNSGIVKGKTPWLTGAEAWNKRVAVFISGDADTINGYNVKTGTSGEIVVSGNTYEISNGSLDATKTFKEEFIEITYSGKYKIAEDGSVITITPGGKKVFIYYTIQ